MSFDCFVKLAMLVIPNEVRDLLFEKNKKKQIPRRFCSSE